MTVRRKSGWSRCMGVILLLISGALSVPSVASERAGDPNEIGWDVTDRFAFVWDSVEVSSQVFNPSYTGVRDLYECQRRLTVVGKIHVLDSNDLVGMQVNDPTVLQVIGSDGNDVTWTPLPLCPLRQYQELEYTWPVPQEPPYRATNPVLQPYDVSVSFCVNPSQRPLSSVSLFQSSSLSLFQWCASALYAEDVIEVDVPFAASDDWLEVAPGVQIRVTKATVECCDYAYWTTVKHPGGSVQALDARLSPGKPVADYLVIGTLLLDAEGNPIQERDDRISPAIWFERVESTSLGTAACGGWLNTFFVTQTEVTSIRHIIVVHPHEVKVPFALTDLPLPSLWNSGDNNVNDGNGHVSR